MQVPQRPRQRALTVSCIGFVHLEGGMHEYVTLHAHSNQATAAPATPLSAMGAVGVCYNKAKTGDCPRAAPPFQC